MKIIPLFLLLILLSGCLSPDNQESGTGEWSILSSVEYEARREDHWASLQYDIQTMDGLVVTSSFNNTFWGTSVFDPATGVRLNDSWISHGGDRFTEKFLVREEQLVPQPPTFAEWSWSPASILPIQWAWLYAADPNQPEGTIGRINFQRISDGVEWAIEATGPCFHGCLVQSPDGTFKEIEGVSMVVEGTWGDLLPTRAIYDVIADGDVLPHRLELTRENTSGTILEFEPALIDTAQWPDIPASSGCGLTFCHGEVSIPKRFGFGDAHEAVLNDPAFQDWDAQHSAWFVDNGFIGKDFGYITFDVKTWTHAFTVVGADGESNVFFVHFHQDDPDNLVPIVEEKGGGEYNLLYYPTNPLDVKMHSFSEVYRRATTEGGVDEERLVDVAFSVGTLITEFEPDYRASMYFSENVNGDLRRTQYLMNTGEIAERLFTTDSPPSYRNDAS